MRLLYEAVERGQPREYLVSQKEWAELFAPFPDQVRYHCANLAAHNWHVIHDGDRVACLAPTQGGQWWNLDGERTDMSDDEHDAFFPRADDSERYSTGYTAYWHKKDRNDYGSRVVKQTQIVMPEPRQ